VPFQAGLLSTFLWFDRQSTLKGAIAQPQAPVPIARVH
jgi:hypothetical protein